MQNKRKERQQSLFIVVHLYSNLSDTSTNIAESSNTRAHTSIKATNKKEEKTKRDILR